MKTRVAGILAMSIVVAAGCHADQQESQREQPANEVVAAPARQSGQVAQDTPGQASIIRPSVLAETEEPPKPPEPELTAVNVTIPFADADGAFPPNAAGLLDALLQRPVVARGGCIVIRGHTDARGSDEQNLRISLRRAEMVRDYLVEQGVDPTRTRLVALGERRPLAPNALRSGEEYPEGQAKNRRVDVEVQLPALAGERCQVNS